MTDPRTVLEQVAREWLENNSGDMKSWAEVFTELELAWPTYKIFISELARLLAAQRAAVLEEAIEIALRNTYMSSGCDAGRNFGGPESCEYACGNVIAQAIRKLAQEQRP